MARSFGVGGVSRLRPRARITRVKVRLRSATWSDGALAPARRSSRRTPRPGHVPRGDLVYRLRQGMHRRLNLVAAPAGWGRRACWPSGSPSRTRRTFAWLSLDEDDNDPARFWAYVVRGAAQDRGRRPRSLRSRRGRARHVGRDAGLPLLDQRSSRPEPGARFRARRLPPHLATRRSTRACASCSTTCRVLSHLVIATRTEPPIGISRLRARAELDEIASDHCASAKTRRRRSSTTRSRSALPADRAPAAERQNRGLGRGPLPGRTFAADRPTARRRERRPRLRSRTSSTTSATRCCSARTRKRARFLLDTCVLDRFCAPLCDAVRDEGGSKRTAGDDRAGQPLPRAAGRASRVVSLPPCLPRGPATRARGHRRRRAHR